MPRFSPSLRSFNGGELSPRMYGRGDLPNYRDGAAILENLIPLVQGPLLHRSGFRFVKEVKDSTKVTRLIPFVVSVEAAYIIEMSDQVFRFYTDEAQLISGTPVEVVTPYLESELFEVQYAQSADVLYLVHKNHAPRKLSRTSPTAFSLDVVDFLDGPYQEQNTDDSKELEADATSGVGVTITATGHSPFDASRDVGRLVRMTTSGTTSGYAVITSVSSGTVAIADVIRDFKSANDKTDEWWLGAWYTDNYPSTVTFFEQRLTFGGAPDEIQTHHLSVTGDFERFSPNGTTQDAPPFSDSSQLNDDNAIRFTIGSNELNAILWARVLGALVLGTASGNFLMSASTQREAITPDNVNVSDEDVTGAGAVDPVRANNTILYADRARRKLLAFGFSIDLDSFSSNDLTELADHIPCAGIKQIAFQKTPFPILWMVCDSGNLSALTFRPEQKVVAWSRHPIGGRLPGRDTGFVESVAVMPEDDQDQVWIVVRREIDGSEVRYVEFLEEPFRILDLQQTEEEAFFVDSGVSYNDPKDIEGATQATPVVITSTGHGFSNGDVVRITGVHGMTELNRRSFTVANQTANTFELAGENGLTYSTYESGGEARKKLTVISGADHLVGEEVTVLADGAPRDPVTVGSGGTITLDRAASHVHLGLYRKAVYESLDIETPDPEGGAAGKQRRFAEAYVRFHDTVGAEIGQEEGSLVPVLFRTASDPMDEPTALASGIEKVSLPNGWDEEAKIRVEQPQPLPMTVTSMTLVGKGGAR